MVSRFRLVMMASGLALLASACIVRSGPPGPGPAPGPGPTYTGGSPATFTVNNQSQYNVCYVFLTQGGDWGSDWLGSSETIPPGNMRTFNLVAGTWHVRMETCDHAPVYQQVVQIEGDITLTFRVYEVVRADTPRPTLATTERRAHASL